MSKVIERLQKRRKWPVDLGDGDKVFIRAMVKREQKESSEIKMSAAESSSLSVEERPVREAEYNELRGYFIFGVVLLEDDGSSTFSRETGESPLAFAMRIESEMFEVPEDHKLAVLQALTKAHSMPSVESISKN